MPPAASRAACVYARRAVEQLVGHLYDVLALARLGRPPRKPCCLRPRFKPDLAVKAAPLTREEVAKLTAQDEGHAKALADKDDLAAAKNAEIAALREQIRAAQTAKCCF
jgi:hypothetical protein